MTDPVVRIERNLYQCGMIGCVLVLCNGHTVHGVARIYGPHTADSLQGAESRAEAAARRKLNELLDFIQAERRAGCPILNAS